MKTLFGERKSVKTLAFILALALILPLLPVMSVVGEETSAQLSEITFVNGAKYDNGYYFMSPDGKKEIYSAESDSGETLTIGNVVLSVKTSNKDIVATYPRVRQDLVFRVIGTNGTDRDDIKVKVEPTTGSTELPFYLPQNDDGTYTLPVIPPSEGVYGTDGHAKVTVESDTSSKILNLTSVATGVEISKIKLGKNKISEKVTATITVSADYASKNLIVETRKDANTDWTAVNNDNLKPSENNPNQYIWTIDTPESNMEARIKLEGTKEFTVKLSEANPNVKGLDNEKGVSVGYGSSLSFTVKVPAGVAEPTVSVTAGSGYTNIVPSTGNGEITYTINNITSDLTVTVKDGSPIPRAVDAPDATNFTYVSPQGTKPTSVNSGGKLEIEVKPDTGYKVTRIQVINTENWQTVADVAGTKVTVSNVTYESQVLITVVPITLTVTIVKGGTASGSYQIPYNTTDQLFRDQKVNLDTLKTRVHELAGVDSKSGPSRKGFTFEKWLYNGQDSSDISDIKVESEDINITMTGTWKADLANLLTMTTEATYDPSAKSFIFVSHLTFQDGVDDDAKAEFSGTNVTVKRYGFIYGQYASTLKDDDAFYAACKTYIANNNQDTKKQRLSLNGMGQGAAVYYSYTATDDGFDGSRNYTQEFTNVPDDRAVQNSGIAFYEISLSDDTTVVIVGAKAVVSNNR